MDYSFPPVSKRTVKTVIAIFNQYFDIRFLSQNLAKMNKLQMVKYHLKSSQIHVVYTY